MEDGAGDGAKVVFLDGRIKKKMGGGKDGLGRFR